MGSPHPNQLFCTTCPGGGAWKEANHFYVRIPGRTPLRKESCADCRQAQRLAHLIHACSEYYGVNAADLALPTRGVEKVARARQSVMYLLHKRCGWSQRRIAAALNRDRTTVRHGIARAGEFLTEQCVKNILDTLKNHTPS